MGWFSKLFGGGPKVMPEAVTDVAGFRRAVLESPLPVIVDVWSETCAPCRALEPVLIDIATRYEGRIRVAEINANTAEHALLARLATQATPTIVIFHRGAEVGRIVGYRPKGWFDDMIATEFP